MAFDVEGDGCKASTYGDTDEWCREIYSDKRLTLKLGAVKVPEDFLGVYL